MKAVAMSCRSVTPHPDVAHIEREPARRDRPGVPNASRNAGARGPRRLGSRWSPSASYPSHPGRGSERRVGARRPGPLSRATQQTGEGEGNAGAQGRRDAKRRGRSGGSTSLPPFCVLASLRLCVDFRSGLEGASRVACVALEPRVSALKPRECGLEPRECGLEPRECGLEPRECGLEPRECGLEPRECGLEPRECGLEPRECGLEPRECGLEPRGCGLEPRGCGLEPRECGLEPRGCGLEPRECALKPRECALEPRECALEPRECALEPRECALEPRECALEPRECALEPRECAAEPQEYAAEPQEHAAEPQECAAKQKGDIHGRVDQESLRISLDTMSACRAALGRTPPADRADGLRARRRHPVGLDPEPVVADPRDRGALTAGGLGARAYSRGELPIVLLNAAPNALSDS